MRYIGLYKCDIFSVSHAGLAMIKWPNRRAKFHFDRNIKEIGLHKCDTLAFINATSFSVSHAGLAMIKWPKRRAKFQFDRNIKDFGLYKCDT
jgi:hypothetical protein